MVTVVVVVGGDEEEEEENTREFVLAQHKYNKTSRCPGTYVTPATRGEVSVWWFNFVFLTSGGPKTGSFLETLGIPFPSLALKLLS